MKPCAYRNSRLPGGLRQRRPLDRLGRGADSRLLTLGWLDAVRGTTVRLHTGNIGARVGVFSALGDPEHSGNIVGVSLRQSWSWREATFGLELDWFSVAAALRTQEEARLGVTMRLPF